MVVCQVLLLTLRFEFGQTSEIAEPAWVSVPSILPVAELFLHAVWRAQSYLCV